MSGLREVLVPVVDKWTSPDDYRWVQQMTAAIEAAVLAWVRDRLDDADVMEDVCEAIALVSGEFDRGETNAALTAVREALTGHETRSGAPLADERPEMAPGDHRDDERLSGPGMGEL